MRIFDMYNTKEPRYTDQQRGHAREMNGKAEYFDIVTLGQRHMT